MSVRQNSQESVGKLSTVLFNADVPDTPTITSVTDNGLGGVSVAFTPASTGGAATSFNVISSPATTTYNEVSSPINVYGLAAGTPYTFTVAAVNSNGTSAASSASSSVTPSFAQGNFYSIQTASFPSAAANATFNSIPQTYKHLQIRAYVLAASAGAHDVYINFNGDSGTNYNNHYLLGNGSGYVNGATISATKVNLSGNAAGNGSYPLYFSTFIVDIYDYARTDKFKTTRNIMGFTDYAAAWNINTETVGATSSMWRSTNAITSMVITPDSGNFVQYSHIALYGMS